MDEFLKVPNFKTVENTSESLKIIENLCAEYSEKIVKEYEIKRSNAFFSELFSKLNEQELLNCQRIIETELAKRFDK